MGPPHPTLVRSPPSLEPAYRQTLFAYEAHTILTVPHPFISVVFLINDCILSQHTPPNHTGRYRQSLCRTQPLYNFISVVFLINDCILSQHTPPNHTGRYRQSLCRTQPLYNFISVVFLINDCIIIITAHTTQPHRKVQTESLPNSTFVQLATPSTFCTLYPNFCSLAKAANFFHLFC